MNEINLRIKNLLKEKLKDFIIKSQYSQLIDIIINNTFKYGELKGIYILSMLIIQDDYKLMLPPLKELNNKLFQKESLIGLFKKFGEAKKIDIKEFVFVMHLAIVISNVDSNGIECISDIINEIIQIYDKHLIKYLLNPKKYNTNLSKGNDNNENNGDNGASPNNNGLSNGQENGGVNKEEKNTLGNDNTAGTNYFNDTVTSIYFFCDLVKTNELDMDDLGNILQFLIRIISDIKSYSAEQKEILIRYYQEILLHYKINTEEDLINIHFSFLKKVHKDNTLNFIEHLLFGTLLINTKKELLTSRIKDFLNMITLVCLNNELNMNDMDSKKLTNFYKFLKQICAILNFKEEEEEEEEEEKNNEVEKNGKNGKEKGDYDTKIKIAFVAIESYSNKIMNKYSNIIKKDEDLAKKFKKLKTLISTSAS